MAKNKYAVTVNGKKITRNTDRTYTHLVIAFPNYERDLAEAKSAMVYDRKGWLSTKEEADGVGEWAKLWAKYPDQYPPQRIAEERAKAAAQLVEMGPDPESYAQKRYADGVAKIEAAKAAGTYRTGFVVIGWAGRADLAQKSANSAASYWKNPKIIPVDAGSVTVESDCK